MPTLVMLRVEERVVYMQILERLAGGGGPSW
jgi:hypothetical protein